MHCYGVRACLGMVISSRGPDVDQGLGVVAFRRRQVKIYATVRPGLRNNLLEYIISVVLADKDIAEQEVNFIYHIGQGLGLSIKEISMIFAGMVQRNYVPSLDAIS